MMGPKHNMFRLTIYFHRLNFVVENCFLLVILGQDYEQILNYKPASFFVDRVYFFFDISLLVRFSRIVFKNL